jgi:hypothetical protein
MDYHSTCSPRSTPSHKPTVPHVYLERGLSSWLLKHLPPKVQPSTHSAQQLTVVQVPPSTQEGQQRRPSTSVPFSGGCKPMPCSVLIVSMQDSNATAAASTCTGAGRAGRRREPGTDWTMTTRVSSSAGATSPLRPSSSFPVLRKGLRSEDSCQPFFVSDTADNKTCQSIVTLFLARFTLSPNEAKAHSSPEIPVGPKFFATVDRTQAIRDDCRVLMAGEDSLRKLGSCLVHPFILVSFSPDISAFSRLDITAVTSAHLEKAGDKMLPWCNIEFCGNGARHISRSS